MFYSSFREESSVCDSSPSSFQSMLPLSFGGGCEGIFLFSLSLRVLRTGRLFSRGVKDFFDFKRKMETLKKRKYRHCVLEKKKVFHFLVGGWVS